MHDIGFMDAGLQGSPQLMAICDDMLGWIRAAAGGVPVTGETLALDVVEELGPKGNYLSHDHTYRHFKDAYYPKLADRQIYSAWEAGRATTMAERAAQKVDEIIENHRLEPLPGDVKRVLRKKLNFSKKFSF